MIEDIKNRLAESNIDFVGRRQIAAVFSTIMVVASWVVFFGFPGPNWGIDFTGGTEIHLAFEDQVDIFELRETLGTIDIPNDAVQEVGAEGESEFKVRIKDPEFGTDELRAEIDKRLTDGVGADRIDEIKFSAEVGARFSVIYNGDRIPPETLSSMLAGMQGVKVEEGREENELVIKLPGLSSQVEKTIKKAMGDRDFEVLAVDAVGPKVGESLRRQGFSSLLATLGLVLLYIAFRFDVAFAPGAIMALVHDVSVTVGIFVLLGKEFNLPIIGALLTIVGYSLNDTIVIYDRIRENRARYSRHDLTDLINVSINETLARTVATSVTTFLAIVAFLFIGSAVIKDFVLAMICGIVFGTYSTVFVASPMILTMEKVKPYLSGLIALPELEDDEDGDVPDAFLSASEQRRRERARLEKEREEDENA
jgi:preprotein translocase subunit SecF